VGEICTFPPPQEKNKEGPLGKPRHELEGILKQAIKHCEIVGRI